MASPSNPGKRVKMCAQKGKAPPPVEDRINLKRWFSNKKQIATYTTKFASKNLVPPKYLSLFTFTHEGFAFPALLEFQGLNKLVEDSCDVLQDLVKVFYSNLHIEDGVLCSEVKKTKIKMTDDVWENAFGIKPVGQRVTESKNAEWEDFNRITYFESLVVDPGHKTKNDRLNAGALSVDDRMLHYIIVWVLTPSGTNHAQLSTDDLLLLYGIKNKLQIDWVSVVKEHMLKCHKLTDSELPYGIPLTRTMRYCEVDTKYEGTMPLRAFNLIGKPSLRKMFSKVNGIWVKKFDAAGLGQDVPMDEPPHDDEEGAAEDATMADDAPVFEALDAPPSTLDLILQGITDLKNIQIAHHEEHRAAFASLDSRMTSLEEKFDSFRS